MRGQRDSSGGGNPSPTPSLEGRGFSAIAGDFQFFKDSQQHAIGVLQHVVVPEADHAVAVGFDHAGSRFVDRTFIVLPAIKLNCDPGRATGEIDHEIADRKLSCELHSTQLAGAQVRPQAPFRVGHIPPQFARDVGQSFSYQGRTPIPNPFPQGKGLSVAKPA